MKKWNVDKFTEEWDAFLKEIEDFIRENRKSKEFNQDDRMMTDRIVENALWYCGIIYRDALTPEGHLYHRPEESEAMFENLRAFMNGVKICHGLSTYAGGHVLKMVDKKVGMKEIKEERRKKRDEQ